MSARRIVLIVVAASLGGLLVLALGVFGLVAIVTPHYLTGAELAARPEGRLVYPGAQQLQVEMQDETHPLIEGPTDAAVIRYFATGDSMDAVVAWYGKRLASLGYSPLPSNRARAASWRRGTSYFNLTYGRPTSSYARPAGTNAFIASFSVLAGS